MKRKIASFLLVFVALLTFSGCSPTTKAYLEDSKKVNQWNNVSINGDMNVQLTMEGKTVNLPLNIKLDGSDLTKDAPMLAYQVTFGEVKGLEALAPGEEGKKLNNLLRGKSVQYYLDLKNMKFAYNKNFLLDMMKATGSEVPSEFAGIKEEYIGIDMGDLPQVSPQAFLTGTAMANTANSDEILKIFEKTFSDFDHKAFNITKEDDTYHYEVGGLDLYNGLMAGAKHFVAKWPSIKGDVAPLLTAMVGKSITDQDIREIQTALAELEKNDELKQLITGAKLSQDVRFGTSSYTTKGKLSYNAPDGQFALSLAYDLTTKKDDSIKVTMPKSVYYIDYTELFGDDVYYDNNTAIVEVDGEFVAEGYVENGRTLVRYRDFAEAIGAEVNYDAKRKQVKVSKDKQTITLTLGSKKVLVNNKVKQLDVVPVVKEGITYVPLRFVAETYGYKVSWDNDLYIASLSKVA